MTLNRGGYILSAIKNGSYTLVQGTDYTVSGNIVTLKASYLATLNMGTHTVTFDMNGGTDPTFTVTVTDTTAPPAQQNPFTDVPATAW